MPKHQCHGYILLAYEILVFYPIKPLTWSFRDVLGITKATDILEHIESLPMGKQEEAMEAIQAIERRAMSVQRPQPGLLTLMDYLNSKGIQKGICTRNFK